MARSTWVLVLATLGLAGLVAPAARADDPPPLPFLVKDVCPADHCAFGTWVAAKAMTAYAFEGNYTRPAFTVAAGERFLALGGNLHTFRPGKALVRETFADPPESRNPFDRFAKDSYILLLAPRGGGYYDVWYHNRRRGVRLSMAEHRYFMPGRDQVELVEPATWTWWVLIKNRAGRTGWLGFPGIVTGEIKGLR